MFSSLLICLCVCLRTTLQTHVWTDFREIFRIGRAWQKEQSGKFGGVMFNHLSAWFLFMCFQGNPCLLATSREHGWMYFHEIFSNISVSLQMRHETNWKIFGMLLLTPWIQDRFFYFLGPCLFVMLWKNGRADFHEIVMKCRGDASNNYLDCFTPA